jgi:hypothetical protein
MGWGSMAEPEGKKKVLKFKLLEGEEGGESPEPLEDRVSFKIPGAALKGPKIKLKILGEKAPASLKGLEEAPGVTVAALSEIKSMLENMNKYQKRIAELEKAYEEEEDKRLVVEGQLKELKPRLEKAEAELEKYREMEKEYLNLKQQHEKLSREKSELEAMCAKEDLKHLKESLWAVDGYMDRLKRDLKEGAITQKEYDRATKPLLKQKWDVQHRMLILEDILKKAVTKTELVIAAKERRAKELKLVRREPEAEKPEKVREKEVPKKEKEKPKEVEAKPEKRERKAVTA